MSGVEKELPRRFPRISDRVAEHLAATEPFYDLCIVLGFGLGAKKTKGKAVVPELEISGDNIGREGRNDESRFKRYSPPGFCINNSF